MRTYPEYRFVVHGVSEVGGVKAIDLFSGIGGASLAMQAANIEVVAHAEVEPFPCRVLEHRFPGVPNLGDVEKITADDLESLGNIDVVSFGSPCQDWSVAGKRLGLKGHRSSLFHEAIRIVRLCQPRFAVFENVPGLFSSAGGWDFAAVLDEMAESGALDIAWRVLDAQWFGVPQRRRRIFLIADFRGERAGEILSLSEGVQRHPAPSREKREGATPLLEVGARTNGDGYRDGDGIGEPGDSMYSLQAAHQHGVHVPETSFAFNANERWDGESETFIPIQDGREVEKGQNGIGDSNPGAPAYTVDTLGAGAVGFYANSGYKEDPVSGADAPLKGGKENAGQAAVAFAENQRAEVRTSEVHPQLTAGGGKAGQGYPAVAQPMSVREDQRTGAIYEMPYTSALASQGGKPGQGYQAVHEGMAVRRLTPTECERLQGFPDGWTDIRDASDSARYRALGNAWAVPVGAWAMKRITGAA